MHTHSTDPWRHSHVFGQDRVQPGERKTLIVIGITATMMTVEIAAGLAFGSMALLADGLHMASHATALGIALFAYVFARRHAHDERFSFGTGKVNALGGYTGAVLLAVFALLMAAESVHRLIAPVSIAFNQAIAVSLIGLLVNGACALILTGPQGHHHHHHHGPDDHHHTHGHHHEDHNLRSARLHVLADALTSVLAVIALLAAKHLGLVWMDPLMGIVGAGLVARWSLGLLVSSGGVLLDRQAPASVHDAVVASLETGTGDRVADLHIWSIGPGLHAAVVSIVTHDPRDPAHYKSRLPPDAGLAHVTIEVHRCPSGPATLAAERS